MQESPGADPTAEVAGSGRGRHRLALAVVRRGEARRLAGVRVFSSFGGRFSIRIAPTGSERRRERVYANLNQRRAATKLGNCEVARPVLVDGEGGLLELPSSFSIDQLLQSAVENPNLVAI
jgi:hypothetical protein